MAITKLFGFIPKATAKLGIMTNKQVIKTCLDVGEDLTKSLKSKGGTDTFESVLNIIKGKVPNTKNLHITNELTEAQQFMTDMHIDNKLIDQFSQYGQAMVLKNYKGKTLFFLPVQNFADDKLVNVATHELQHALYRNSTIDGKAQNLFFKLIGPKNVEKLSLKHSNILNDKAMKVQLDLIMKKIGTANPGEGVLSKSADTKGLLEHMNLSSEKRLDAQLRRTMRNVLDKNSEKSNIKYLKGLREMLKDENRSYTVGGKSAKTYLELENGSTMSEMTGKIYAETAKAVKNELQLQRVKRLKRLLGLKVRNYEGKNFRLTKVDQSETSSELTAKFKETT